MTNNSGFSGFPREGVDFLGELKLNNTKPWFQEHKNEYEKFLVDPARAFILEMGTRLTMLSPSVTFDPRIDKSLFRIYRDIRFSKDKTPYKTHLAIWFWEGNRKKVENSGYYFQLDADLFLLAVGLYTFPPDLIDNYRQAVDDDKSGQELITAVELVESKGYDVSAETYKRVPGGYAQDHPRMRFLKYKGFGAMKAYPINEILHSTYLIDFCYNVYEDLSPLHNWLVKYVTK